jgi:hypothetical protein
VSWHKTNSSRPGSGRDSSHEGEPRIALLDDLRCEAGTTSRNPQSRESSSTFKGRRSFIGGMATLGAGFASSVILPASAVSQPIADAPSKTKSVTGVCGRSLVIASDAATVAETTSGKIRGFRRNGVYIFKGVPYGASTAGARRFMPIKPEPWTEIRNALQYGRICPNQDSAHLIRTEKT